MKANTIAAQMSTTSTLHGTIGPNRSNMLLNNDYYIPKREILKQCTYLATNGATHLARLPKNANIPCILPYKY
jgi:hypothetical protein